MLVIKAELHNANTGEVSVLGEMHIINDGTRTKWTGNYDVFCWDGPASNGRVDPIRSRVEDWPRYPYPSVWLLVLAALQKFLFVPREGQ